MNFPTLTDVARQAIYEDGEQTTHKVQLAVYHAVQAVKRLAFDVVGQRLRADLTVAANRTVALPPAAVGLSALLFNGKPVLDDPTALGTSASGWKSAQSADAGSTSSGAGRFYGADTPLTNTAGHCHYDQMSGVIALSPDCPAQPGDVLVAIYSGNGIATTGDTLVHPWSEQFVISYVQHKMMQPRRTVGPGEKQLKKQEVDTELRLAQKRHSKMTKADWINALTGRQRRTL